MPYRLFGHGANQWPCICVCGPFRKLPRIEVVLLSSCFAFWQHLSLSLSPFSVEKGMFSESGKRSWLQVSCSETTKNHTPVTHCSGLTSSRSLQVTSFVFFGFFDIHDSAEEAGQIVPKARTQTLEGETEPGRVWPFGCVFFSPPPVAPKQLWRSSFRSSSRTSPVGIQRSYKVKTMLKRLRVKKKRFEDM